MEDKIITDLKEAMLAKDARRTSVLRSLKSALTYAKVAPNVDQSAGLGDDAVIQILAKEAKKRQESADSFLKAGLPERADDELAEKNIIEEYLPAQPSEDELRGLIEDVVATLDSPTPQAMGQVIGAVKAKAGAAADGSVIARLVQERLRQAQ